MESGSDRSDSEAIAELAATHDAPLRGERDRDRAGGSHVHVSSSYTATPVRALWLIAMHVRPAPSPGVRGV